MEESLADMMGIDTAEVGRGLFMGRLIADMQRDDLLAIIGWQARQQLTADRRHAADMATLLGR